MDSGRDKTSLKGSQTNVTESAQPLLETVSGVGDAPRGTPERERTEGAESTLQKGSSSKDIAESGEAGSRRLRPLTCIDSFTRNMNLLDRDSLHINDHINVSFEEVLAEPRVNQSFDQIWRFAYVLFAGTKLWAYRVLAAVFAVPCGLLWGLIFSLLAVASVWLITPAMKVVEVLLQVVIRVWGGAVRAILDPVFQSASILVNAAKKERGPPYIQEIA
ncbi:caveolin-1-like [Argiope bruennichi]|uniref:Caveolin n=1 Tax=Argiope bruennichi TaxID=94029 RepID=A0A8T0FKX7_ARGBR|nr:caveolin-1-like [Argiope bruennichi]XP_055929582.1 caveolin-1-like [Argiope bruennichi]XP_055929583.1 caveolin-1-like [Argiope bruennichi]KAF8791132.1 Caveolin-1 like protein [Argiope bruennichi]